MERSPWTKLGIKIELNTCLTRQVLSEKYCPEKAKKIEMANFFFKKINGCELATHKDYENYIFYIKNKKILLEKDIKNKCFYIKYTRFWTIFQNKYKLNNSDIQLFTQHWLEEFLLNSKCYQTGRWFQDLQSKLEESISSKGYQTDLRIEFFV